MLSGQMDNRIARTIADIPVFGQWPEPDRARLLSYSGERIFTAGDVLFRRGDPAVAFCVVLDGTVGLTLTEDEGSSGVVDMVRPGELAGDEAVFDRGPHTASAIALTPVTALVVAAEPFLAHLETRFELVLTMLAGASSRLRGLVHDITELKLQSTTQRLAGYLVRLAGAQQGRVRLMLPCEKQLLAERLGMKPESLSRSLSKLRAQGVHAGRPDIVEIDDIDVLRAFWQSSDGAPED
jgi:cAMP-binding proteins - catabolite gene activator and regulatory subunit of cAMP-dependent protein kinases